ncbi:MAG: hypothetical protein FWG30_11355 [Eubacteriaceae bacterium]|nr:hypothetical protein [Eubacteriaceae bacterium]
MDSKTKLKERISTIQDAVAFKKTGRIPTFSNYWTYMILESGNKLSEALYDYSLLFSIVTGFHEKYGFDLYNYKGARNPFRVTEAIDGNKYIIDDERETFNLVDYEIMHEDEYSELIKDPIKFYWSVCLPRKNKALGAPGSFEAFVKSIEEYKLYNAFIAKTEKYFLEELEVPVLAPASLLLPVETLFNFLRGIKGLSIDLRRRPHEVEAAVEAIGRVMGLDQVIGAVDGPMPEYAVFGGRTVLLGHSVLNPKQFEKLYWPYIKKWVDACERNGKQFQIFSEAQVTTFTDFFQEFPKGTVMLQPEQDDVFELRRRLPNVAICGGMKSSILGTKSKQECIDYAKRLIDTLGANGGFVMGPDKMMTYRNDAKPENILAVQELCETYTG